MHDELRGRTTVANVTPRSIERMRAAVDKFNSNRWVALARNLGGLLGLGLLVWASASTNETLRWVLALAGALLLAAAVVSLYAKWKAAVIRRHEQSKGTVTGPLSEHDSQLFASIRDVLSSGSGAIPYMRDHPFSLTFEDQRLADARRYLYASQLADNEFIDAEMEEARLSFAEALANFFGHLSTHAFPRDGQPGYYRIYPDVDVDWVNEDNQYAIDAMNEADRLSAVVWNAHQELIRIGVRRGA